MSQSKVKRRAGCIAATAMAVITLGGVDASADTITFAPPGTTVNGDDLRFSIPGFSVTASAYESTILDPNDVLFGDSRTVTVSASGLGVDGHGTGESPFQIDGVGVNEFLKLTFSTVVSLTRFTVRNVDMDFTDGIRVYVGNSWLPAFTRTGLTSSTTVITLPTALVGSTFTFSVAGGSGNLDPNRTADYSLSAVDVQAAPVAIVPIPPAVLGGGALLVGLAAYRRLRAGARDVAV